MACKIIVSAPVPFLFLWTLDFNFLDLNLWLGFGTWIWDLDLGLGIGLGLDKNLMSSMDSENHKYLYVQMHTHTFNALFRPSHWWLMSSNILSEDLWSIVYRVQGELLFLTQRMWSDLGEVRRLGRTNILDIAIICEFWLSITNMCDMWHVGTDWCTLNHNCLFIVLNFTPRQ